MKRVASCLALLVSCAAAADSPEALLARVTEAGRSHDREAWMLLYCGNHILTRGDTEAVSYFSSASLADLDIPGREEKMRAITLCFQSPQEKERCMFLQVSHRQDMFCLLEPR